MIFLTLNVIPNALCDKNPPLYLSVLVCSHLRWTPKKEMYVILSVLIPKKKIKLINHSGSLMYTSCLLYKLSLIHLPRFKIYTSLWTQSTEWCRVSSISMWKPPTASLSQLKYGVLLHLWAECFPFLRVTSLSCRSKSRTRKRSGEEEWEEVTKSTNHQSDQHSEWWISFTIHPFIVTHYPSDDRSTASVLCPAFLYGTRPNET